MKIRVVESSSQTRVSDSGFTLVELMVTIVVLGVIVSIAAPNISTQLANQRIKSTAATLSNALAEAKSESLIRRKSVMVSYDNNGSSTGSIDIEVEEPNLTAYSGPALYLQKPPEGSGTGGNGSGGGNTGGGSTGGGSTGGGSTGGGSTGGGSTGGGGDTGGSTGGGDGDGDEDSGPGGSIPAPVISYGVINTYQYNAKTTITASSTQTVFKPNKSVDPALTYTICDSNDSATAMQVTVSALGIVSSQIGGVCTSE